MVESKPGAGHRPATRLIRAIFRGSAPFVVAFACVLAANWGMAIWLIHDTRQEREAAVLQMLDSEIQYAERGIADLFADADVTIQEARARFEAGGLDLTLQRWAQPRKAAGIALLAPDGHVLASSSGANTAGWPGLMTRLAQTPVDVLAIGQPIPARAGQPALIPIARALIRQDGAFGGIALYSLRRDALPEPGPAIAALDGCLVLRTDDGVILKRIPDVRGTTGIRVPLDATLADQSTGARRHISRIDGVDRIYVRRHVSGVPVTLFVGVGHDAAFADWNTMRMIVIGARYGASAFILVTAWLWYTRRRRARISSNALTTVLNGVDQAIRIESGFGGVIANGAGSALAMPDASNLPTETSLPDGRIIRTTRHDLAGGGTVLIGTDLTASRTAAARIAFLDEHDRLTGLLNRWAATARIDGLIATKPGTRGALILFDLDGFQDINDTLGHRAGDAVLTEVAARLRDLAAGNDVVARLGGDEFLLFLDSPDDEASVMSLARQIPSMLGRPIQVYAHSVHLGASLGIALHPNDGADVRTLFRHADIALSHAKRAGRGTAKRFEPGMMAAFEENRMMESDLRRALDSDELELRLQPQFSCDTLEVTGFEALTRWNHPTRGPLSPAAFIPIAERSGLINPLGLWAIEQACKAAAGWRARHRVAVNLSPSQLRSESIEEDIRGILRRTQFPAHLLELEVTESVLLDGDKRTLEALHRLRAMDIRVTLDDFGTGYSSLSYLRRFPFDKIKIDKSFVQGQGTDRGTRVILEAMIRMCSELGLDVVAEGIETEHQLAELRRLGCREVQGYLLGEPLLPAEVDVFLAGLRRRDPAPLVVPG